MQVGTLTKSSSNPHFKSKFVPLEAVITAVRPALHENGLCFTQSLRVGLDATYLETTIHDYYNEEQEIVSEYPLNPDPNPQKFAAQITYARRYALMTLLGIPAEDDDGNTAAGLSGALEALRSRK